MTTLLVEDDEGIRGLLTEILEGRGHAVVPCADAESAWEAAEEAAHGLIIVDWLLPRMDGLELCRRIRTLPHGTHSHILLLTALPLQTHMEAALAAGADDYLTKPFDLPTLHLRLAIAERYVAAVAARAQAAAALRASEARKAAILEIALDAIITVDHTGHITEFNPAAEALFGYSHGEALGQPVSQLIVPPARRERNDAMREQVVREGQGPALGRRVEGQAMRRDGTEFPIEVATLRIPGTTPPLFVGYIRDLTARVQAEEAMQAQTEALRHQALHDGLTGLPNRILFRDRLAHALAHARREGSAVAVLLIDLNHFKEINDTLGHHAGDSVLSQVAERLRGALRATDTVARWGGDEFALLLPHAELAGAVRAAQSLLAALATPLAVEGRQLAVGASIGIAVTQEQSAGEAALLQDADRAMYRAKRGGGGYAIHAPALDLP